MRIKKRKGNFKIHKLIDLGNTTLLWSFDTFRTPKGYDKLICNGIRLIGLFGFLFVMISQINWLLQLFLLFIFMLMVGFTKVVFFQNNFKKFEFEAW